MNSFRFFRGDWSPWAVGILVLLVVLLFAVVLWSKRRERRGDWGPGLVGVSQSPGFSPADLRGEAARATADDPREAWLLGLAAPFVEQAALLHDRWSLVPAFCGDDWRRRLFAVAGEWGAVRAGEWKTRVAALERALAEQSGAGDDVVDQRPWLVASLAMQLRLGVAARHTSAPRARARLAAAADPLRSEYADWLGFGDALIAAAELYGGNSAAGLRAGLRLLYAQDGPWHEMAWPE